MSETETGLHQLRAAQNQVLFRHVNERLLELNEAFDMFTERAVFVCECPTLGCVQQIEIALGEYERVRANPRRFVVAPSSEHVGAAIERIVERHDRYFVVEKTGVGGEVAAATAGAERG